MTSPRIAVFGASGLIGGALVRDLGLRGFPVLAIARRFSESGRGERIEVPFAQMNAEALGGLLAANAIDIVVNCVGVLQGGAETAHVEFPARLLAAMRALGRPALLIHVTIPAAATGATEFSRSKRRGEIAIEESGLPFVLLRPGFVVASAAFGGGALIRALAASPLRLPPEEAGRPFRITAMSQISETVAWAAAQWERGRRDFAEDFDVMSPEPLAVGDVVEAFRVHFGGPRPRIAAPKWLLEFGGRLADAAARLGWAAPIRSTALAEMRRGVSGDPGPWIAATGLQPRTFAQALIDVPPSVQERWFARLYLLKGAVVATLAAFYALSGAIALSFGFAAAQAQLTARGFSPASAAGFVALTAWLDLVVAALVAVRRTHRAGLIAAMALALAYLAGGTWLAPELWLDPLGPYVKVFPALALAAVALALADNR